MKPLHILIVGSEAFAEKVCVLVNGRGQVDFVQVQAITIEFLLGNWKPDLAILNADESPSGGADTAMAELQRFRPRLPIVLVSSIRPSPVVAAAAYAVLRPAEMRSHLASLIVLLVDVARLEMPKRAPNLPLGIVDQKVSLGDHIAYLWESDRDLEELLRFWTSAARTDGLLLVAPADAQRKLFQTFTATGQDPSTLIKTGRLSTLPAAEISLELIQQLIHQLTAVSAHRSTQTRMIGLAAGWNETDKKRFGHICEHILDKICTSLPAVIVCPYRTRAPFIFDRALATHPFVITNNKLIRNPFYAS